MKIFVLAAVSAAALLTACGGGGNSGETKAKITSVKVVGASLADSGTFGYKFTVQSGTGTPYKVYPERIAATYGLPALCPAYVYSPTTSPFPYAANTAQAACTNYAIAASAVNYVVGASTPGTGLFGTAYNTAPTSLIRQLADLATATGTFSSGDLLIVGEGSANDASNLATAYLFSRATGNSCSTLPCPVNAPNGDFRQLMATLIDSTTLAGLTDIQAGGYYMQLLAKKLVTAVKTSALDKGASRVVMLNTLDVTKTPKFQATLETITINQGATAAGQVQQLLQGWIKAYNTALDSEVAALGSNSSKVAVVDFYTNFNAEMDDPVQYGLTNTSGTVCDQIYSQATSVTPTVQTAGTTSLSPTYAGGAVKGYCKDTTASTVTPTANNTGTAWWQTYLYADNFHPTPYGHQLLAQLVAKRLTEAGWL